MLRITKKQSHTLLAIGLAVILLSAIPMGIYHIIRSRSQANAYSSYMNGFEAGNIMSDYVMGNSGSMSEADIWNFLHSKNPCNDRNLSKARDGYHYNIRDGHFVCMADESFNGQSTSRIIWQAGQDYGINPQLLIILLEKEQRLVTDTFPSNAEYDHATGFNCPDDGKGCRPEYAGFIKQVRSAAAFFREVLDGGWSNYPAYTWVDLPYQENAPWCGTRRTYIENRATSALYRYTPYTPNQAAIDSAPGTGDACSAYGNRNLYYMFNRWFGYSPRFYIQKSNIIIPDGIYQLESSNNKYLDIAGRSTSDGGNVWLWDRSVNGSQDWQISQVVNGDGSYSYTLKNVRSGKYLDAAYPGIYDGNNVQIWSQASDSCTQKWNILTNADGYKLISTCSGKALDVTNGVIKAGANVQLWGDNGTTAQRWHFISQTGSSVSEGVYRLKTTRARYLDIANIGTINGSNVQIWDQGNLGSQEWIVARRPDGFYTLQNPHSGKYLEVSNSGTSNGSNVQIWDRADVCAQRWSIVNSGNGYKLLSSCSNKALDISSGNDKDGSNVQIWDDNGTDAQNWTLLSANLDIANGTYRLYSSSGKYLYIARSDVRNGSNVQIWDASYTGGQAWTISKTGDGFYTLQNPHSGKYLEVSNSGTSNGSNVQIWDRADVCAQRWSIVNSGNGYKLLSSCSNKALDISNNGSANGTNVQIWNSAMTPAQEWFMKKVNVAQISNGVYRVQSSNNKFLDVAGLSTNNGATVWLWDDASGGSQKWQISSIDNQSSLYMLKNVRSGKYLDAAYPGIYDGNNVQIWSQASDSCTQKWNMEQQDGATILASSCSQKVLDVRNGVFSNGSRAQLWFNNNTRAQRWIITP